MTTSSLNWPVAALRDAELRDRTYMRVGGRARWLLEPTDPEELRLAITTARERGFVPRILGGGCNLIIEDGLHDSVVITTDRMKRCFRPVRGSTSFQEETQRTELVHVPPAEDPRLVVWGGTTLQKLCATATELGLSGMECLAGVPGQLGGGIAMNAGGRYGEMWDSVEVVRVIEPDGRMLDLPRQECTPRYRNGGLGERVVAGAILKLVPQTRAEVRERAKQYLLEKNKVQPVMEWSAGCVFKNPDKPRSGCLSAGQLFERCGLKGRERGDAYVSPLHGNFVINRAHASSDDILGLIEEVRAEVASQTGVELELEVKVWRREPR